MRNGFFPPSKVLLFQLIVSNISGDQKFGLSGGDPV